MVRTERPLGRAQGPSASKLVKMFITNYDAVDTTVPGL